MIEPRNFPGVQFLKNKTHFVFRDGYIVIIVVHGRFKFMNKIGIFVPEPCEKFVQICTQFFGLDRYYVRTGVWLFFSLCPIIVWRPCHVCRDTCIRRNPSEVFISDCQIALGRMLFCTDAERFVGFGENPQAVAYSAQPLCWSGRETSSPTTHRGAVLKDRAEIP